MEEVLEQKQNNEQCKQCFINAVVEYDWNEFNLWCNSVFLAGFRWCKKSIHANLKDKTNRRRRHIYIYCSVIIHVCVKCSIFYTKVSFYIHNSIDF